MKWCVISLCICAVSSDVQIHDAVLLSYFEGGILNRCREYSNFNGAIDFNCRWIDEQPNRACCYVRRKGAQFSDYNFCEDYCSLNVLCRYCENPPSQYQTTTTTTLAPAPTFGWGWEGCFPSTAKVNLQNGKTMTMSELQIGDHVQTVSLDGTTRYSRVIAFLKNQHFTTNVYQSISTSWNNSIKLSRDHLIYARKGYAEKFYPIFADQISIGDELLVPGNDELTPVKVVNVSTTLMQGNHVPLTREGNILVDGVLASCYAYISHDLAHFGTAPFHWSPEIVRAIFGEENGTQIYAIIAAQVDKLTYP